jgi:hypothetical protein
MQNHRNGDYEQWDLQERACVAPVKQAPYDWDAQ